MFQASAERLTPARAAQLLILGAELACPLLSLLDRPAQDELGDPGPGQIGLESPCVVGL